MVHTAKNTLNEVDIIIWMVDESLEIGPGDEYILKELENIKTPKILVINKTDKISKEQVGDIISNYRDYGMFEQIIPISASYGSNVDELVYTIKKFLPDGPQYFPEDMITDQPERLIISEIIREKALHFLEQEVPHGIAVGIDMIKPRENNDIIDINATIYCERDSHKGIIIGKGGRKLKGIGKSARNDIELLLGSKVFLELWVKVNKNWRENERMLKTFGYK